MFREKTSPNKSKTAGDKQPKAKAVESEDESTDNELARLTKDEQKEWTDSVAE